MIRIESWNDGLIERRWDGLEGMVIGGGRGMMLRFV
jgi:hypothetical protein